MVKRTLIVGLLFSAVCGCNNPPAPQSASHPVATDLTCPAEAVALSDAQVMADDAAYRADPANGHPNQDAQTLYDIISGRACRDALHRVCAWHVERGDKEVDCDKPQALQEMNP